MVDGKLLQQIEVALHIVLLYSNNHPGRDAESHGWFLLVDGKLLYADWSCVSYSSAIF